MEQQRYKRCLLKINVFCWFLDPLSILHFSPWKFWQIQKINRYSWSARKGESNDVCLRKKIRGVVILHYRHLTSVLVQASIQPILCITLDQCCPILLQVILLELFLSKLIFKPTFSPKLTTASLFDSSQNSSEPNQVSPVSIWRFYLWLCSTSVMARNPLGKPF